MKHGRYKKKISVDEYFKKWDNSALNALTEDLKKRIYAKYLMKCEVFNRDNYSCQNINCKTQDSKITLHHIRFQKNGGEDKARNGVTLCNDCHNNYHKAKMILTFPNVGSLPSHFRGHTFKLDKPDKLDWKLLRADMKLLRKRLKDKHGIVLAMEQIELLMKWLTIPYYEFEDYL